MHIWLLPFLTGGVFMGMRSLERSVARSRMQIVGVERINKRRIWDKNGGKKREGRYRSFFSMYWRKFLDPSSREYKAVMSRLARKKKRV